MNLQEFKDDFQQNVKVAAFSSGEGSQCAFVNQMAEYLIDSEILPGFTYAFYDQIGKRNKQLAIDGYVFDEIDKTMNLIIANYGKTNTFGKRELTASISHVKNFVESSLEGSLEADMSTPAADLKDDLQQFRDIIRKYKILIFTDADKSRNLKEIASDTLDGKPVECQIWDIDRIYTVCASDESNKNIEIKFTDYISKGIPCLKASEAVSDEYESYLCIIPGEVLADIYDQYGSALLEGNVRSFLSTKVAVNKKIRTTILKTPERFFAYNNGISATASELQFSSDGNDIIYAKDLQIINGGQTTASLSNARYKDKASLDKIFVQMKLTKIGAMDADEATNLIRDISKSSNSQNKVSDADFFSTHPFHVQMEKISKRLFAPAAAGQQYDTHWFYERARGQYLQAQMHMTKAQRRQFLMKNPKNQLIKKTDLAKVRNSWDKLPYVVSKGAQTNFVTYAISIDAGWSKDSAQYNEKYFTDSVALMIMFNDLEDLIPKQSWYQSGYRANIITYTIAEFRYLIEKQFPGMYFNFQAVWNNQSVPSIIEDAFKDISKLVYEVITADNRPVINVTQWCKRELCWKNVQKINYKFSDEIKNYLVDKASNSAAKSAAKNNQIMDNGFEAQAKVVNLGAVYWKKLQNFVINKHVSISPNEISSLKAAVKIPNKLPQDFQCVYLLKLKERAEENGFSN